MTNASAKLSGCSAEYLISSAQGIELKSLKSMGAGESVNYVILPMKGVAYAPIGYSINVSKNELNDKNATFEIKAGHSTFNNMSAYKGNANTAVVKENAFTTYTSLRNTSVGVGSAGKVGQYVFDFVPHAYKVRYNGNGATAGSMTEQTGCLYDKTYTTRSNGFEKVYNVSYDALGGNVGSIGIENIRSEASFLGWSTSATGNVTHAHNGPFKNLTASAPIVDLYAKWSAQPKIILPEASWDGYTFVGWEADRAVAEKYNKNPDLLTDEVIKYYQENFGAKVSKNVTGSTTYYAIWKAHPKYVDYTVKYHIETTIGKGDWVEFRTKKISGVENNLKEGAIVTGERISIPGYATPAPISIVLKSGRENVINYYYTAPGTNDYIDKVYDGKKFEFHVDPSGRIYYIKGNEQRNVFFTKNGWMYEYAYNDNGTVSIMKGYASSKAKKEIIVPSVVSFAGNNVKVQDIYANAFKGKKNIESVVIESGISIIGNSAFKNCSSLKNVTIGKTVKSIGSSAFEGCSKLKKVTFKGNAVTSMKKAAFKNCKALISINLVKLSKLKTISGYAFFGCKKLKNVTLPKKIKKLGKQAFGGCKKLKTLKVTSNSLKKIGDNVFDKGKRVKIKYVRRD